jgi:hypothetical protein
VRILGLAPGDLLEYRVVTTTSRHPLAPDFWLDHTFDRSGVVSHENFELDVPLFRFEEPPQSFPSTDSDPLGIAPPGPPKFDPYKRPLFGEIRISPATKEASKETVGQGSAAHLLYKWNLNPIDLPKSLAEGEPREPDVMLTTFRSWGLLARRINTTLYPYSRSSDWPDLTEQLRKFRANRPATKSFVQSIYAFISDKIKTVDLPLGSNGYRTRPPREILSSGYGTTEDKAALFLALLPVNLPPCDLLLFTSIDSPASEIPRPSIFSQLIVSVQETSRTYLDLSLEVAPIGVLRSDLRGKPTLILAAPGFGWMNDGDNPEPWRKLPTSLPFPSFQRVNVGASITSEGTLNAKVHYTMRGDNELLLRVAFHQSPKEKWKEVAQLLALSDGFRGKITNVTASDPYATKEPFSVEYEISQPKFVDWGKKPVRIPALLPQLGLPDSAAKPGSGAGTSAIDLGTPLDVDTRLTLHLPAGTSARTPAGTSVERDYATFASKYVANGATVTATRHLNFLLREVQGDRAADYNAFVQAVQGDEAQEFTLERGEVASQQTKPESAAKKN